MESRISLRLNPSPLLIGRMRRYSIISEKEKFWTLIIGTQRSQAQTKLQNS